MKLFALLFLPLLSSSAAIAAEKPYVYCLNTHVLEFREDGSYEEVPTGVSYSVMRSSQGKYGWAAVVTQGQESVTINDVDVTDENPANVSQAQEIAALVKPDLDWSRVASVRVANIAVEANRDDGAGAFIMELFDSRQESLAKFMQVGWGVAVCK
jgi:hypothetical protein